MSAKVCNFSKTLWKYRRHLDNCEISDNSESSDSSDGSYSSDISDRSYNGGSREEKHVCTTLQQFVSAINHI